MNTKNELQLRPFSPEHAASVTAWPQSAAEARWWAGPNTQWPLRPETLERWHADPDVRPYVLAGGDVPLAYGELWLDAAEQEVELARLIVAPKRRGQGVGRQLVQLLLAEARHTDYPQAFLRVVPENSAATACYLHAGFNRLGADDQQRFNQGQPVAYLWMSAALDPHEAFRPAL